MADTAMIRRASPADADAVAMLLTELSYPTDAGTATGILQTALTDPAQQVLVVEIAGGIVGLAATTTLYYFHIGQRIARLSSLVVREAERGQQLGERLLAAAEQWACEQGCQQLELSSSIKRERAHAFYVRAGYQPSAFRFIKRLTR